LAVAYTFASLPTPLKLWEKIELVVGENIDCGRYSARVEDITSDSIFISEPEFVGGTVRLREGISANIYVNRDDATYKFEATIRHAKRDNISVVSLPIPKEIHRIQRRQFVRIECNERVSVMRIDGPLPVDGSSVRPWRDTVAVNISGGGICFHTNEQWNSGERIVLRIPFLKSIDVSDTLLGICCRCFENHGRYYAGAEFIRRNDVSRHFSSTELKLLPDGYDRFDHHNQNRLVNYIFNQQIELRKKGLL
jgi:c-di-GMP-binding flagellar brake protein YcgR